MCHLLPLLPGSWDHRCLLPWLVLHSTAWKPLTTKGFQFAPLEPLAFQLHDDGRDFLKERLDGAALACWCLAVDFNLPLFTFSAWKANGRSLSLTDSLPWIMLARVSFLFSDGLGLHALHLIPVSMTSRNVYPGHSNRSRLQTPAQLSTFIPDSSLFDNQGRGGCVQIPCH